MKKLITFLICNLFGVLLFAQKISSDIDLTDASKYFNVSVRLCDYTPNTGSVAIFKKNGFIAVKSMNAFKIRANTEGVLNLAKLPFVCWIERETEYNKESILNNAASHSNLLNNKGLNGNGHVICIADDGEINSHIDFKGRIIAPDTFSNLVQGSHGELTAGIAAGAGNLDEDMKGILTEAKILSLSIVNYPQIFKAVENQNRFNCYVTSTSYGQGNCSNYNSNAQYIDRQVFENPHLLHVFSAGNSGQESCFGVNRFMNITGGFKAAKNIIAVGNVNLRGELSLASSRGCTFDGRIKPDICAVGEGYYSVDENNTYQMSSGTSSAAPNVAAIAVQLYEAYKKKNNNVAESALIKAVLLNSADDIESPGPDYKSGFGKVDALEAYKILENNQYKKFKIENGYTQNFNLSIPSSANKIKIMLYWHDKESSLTANKNLVNDLDLSAENEVTGEKYLPYVLSTFKHIDSLEKPATFGIDHVNNVEQIYIENLTTDNIRVNIKGFDIKSNYQDCYLVWQYIENAVTVTFPNGNEKLELGKSQTIRWTGEGIFNVAISYDGFVYRTIGRNISGNYFDYTPERDGKALICVSDINSSRIDISDDYFDINHKIKNLMVSEICDNSTLIKWDALPNVKYYIVYKLGTKYVDSIATTQNTYFSFSDKYSDSAWYSVNAVFLDGSRGKRVNSIPKHRYIENCLNTEGVEVLENKIDIYPNPTTGILNIISDEKILMVQIYDILGREIFKSNISQSIDLKGFKDGIYTIVIFGEAKKYIKKIVVKT
jgi:Subtilase family/Secretion system C-terminal sorting domain